MDPRQEQRFWAKVHKGEGCWLWTAGRTANGYGQFMSKRAHRLSYAMAHGLIPDGLCVCHRCDQPLCVRPDHLFLGTPADNNADMDRKGRRAKGQAYPHTKLSPQNIPRILDLLARRVPKAHIAVLFGVTRSAIRGIASGRTWKAKQQ